MQRQLAQLILLNGFQTDADVPGSERLCATALDSTWLRGSHRSFDVGQELQMDPKTLGPESLFMVKGWNRSVACMGVLYAAYDEPDLYKD